MSIDSKLKHPSFVNMDLFSNQINDGEIACKKLKKTKQKIAGGIPECNLSRENVSVDNGVQEAEVKGKKKKHKSKETLEEGAEVNEVIFGNEKQNQKKKLCDTFDVQEDRMAVDDLGCTDYNRTCPKEKKKRVVKDNICSFDKIDQEISPNPKFHRRKKKKHLENNAGVGEDCSDLSGNINELPLDSSVIENEVLKRKLGVFQGDSNICDSDHLDNLGTKEVESSNDVRRKKRKINKCSIEEDSIRIEKFVKDTEVLAPLKGKKKGESVSDLIFVPSFYGDAEVKEKLDDTSLDKNEKRKFINEFVVDKGFESCVKVKAESVHYTLSHKKKKEKKLKNDSLVEGTDCSSAKEGPVEDNKFHKKKMKTTNESLLSVQEDIDTTENVKKEEHFEENLMQKKRGQKPSKKSENDEIESFCGNSTRNQLNNRKKPRDKRKHKVLYNQQYERKQYSDRRIASQWRERFQPKYKLITPQDIGDWQAMVFKFDNHPNVRHYVPRKLMAMNGIEQQLGEVNKIDLKIPNVMFKGSSLGLIPGYGYDV